MFPASFPVPPQAKVQLFTSSGQFIADPASRWILVEGIGGGESGQSLFGSTSVGGDGGLYDWILIPASMLTGPVLVTIGAGGVAGTTSSSPRNPGGDTKFGNFLTCKGGGNGFVDAAGGIAAAGANSLHGGGAGGGCNSSGTAYPGGASLRAGAGGPGATNGSGAAPATSNGTAPGGGGGANSSGGYPGAGALGQMKISQW